MVFFKSLWFAIALAVTLAFVAFVAGPSYALTRFIWHATGVPRIAQRQLHSAFMFHWARPTFGIFCFLMQISVTRTYDRTSYGTYFRPAIVLSNHQSMTDIFLLMTLLPEMACRDARWIMKRELGRIPFIGHVCRGNASAFIDRRDRAQAEAAIREAARLADFDGASLVLFPEGTRFTRPTEGPAPDGGPAFRNLLPPKPGGFLTLRRMMKDHDLLVVTIDYGGLLGIRTIFQLGKLFGRRVTVRAERHREQNADAHWLNERWREMDCRLEPRT